MNSNAKCDGLSARRKTILKITKTQLTSLWGFILFLCILLLGSCHEKTRGQQSTDANQKSPPKEDSISKPQVNINVNRRFDDKGNLVGFDSLYSTYYSNIKGDTAQMDSIMHGFDTYFQSKHPTFFNNRFNTLFFNDSLRYPDFFHDDFFMEHYQLNDTYMRDMMTRMDSIKNQFFKDQHLKNNKEVKPKTRS